MTTLRQRSFQPASPASTGREASIQSVCGYCATGCLLTVQGTGGAAPAPEGIVNSGAACPKGWEALTVLEASDRGTHPLRRDDRGRWHVLSWPEAIHEFCKRLQSIGQRFGPASVAFLGSGQLPTEEIAFLGSLAKFGMRMLHGDSNTRQCMASAVTAYEQAFGFDAPPYCYDDLEQSDVLFLIGSNLSIAHPILWSRIRKSRQLRRLVVVDPRRTETAMAADEHVALVPKSDLELFYGIARVLLERDWIDRAFIDAHTRDFDAFARHVRAFSLERVAARTGISPARIERLAEWIHAGERVSFWWTMGVNQSHQGVRTAQAIINLALMTGNIGRPGTGPNSITGQCNAMGSRLFSNTTSLLGGHKFTDRQHREKVARRLEIPVESIPTQPSWPYHRILEGIVRGDIKALWIVGTNPAHSWIHQGFFRDVVDRLEFLVVQDMYSTTETARLAHLYLPAAGWGEKEGTVINSERRVGRVRRVRKPPGEAFADFTIFQRIAEAWGCATLFKHWTSPDAVFSLLTSLTEERPCDLTGITSYDQLETAGGIQWPFPANAAVQNRPLTTGRRLFEDGQFYHADGRARFVFDAPREPVEIRTERFPYRLLTGRGSAAQWHTQTRTAKSSVLRQMAPPSVYVEMHPEDAYREGLRPGQTVIVESARGRLRASLAVTPTVPRGSLFIPMHYSETNRLTHAAFDPESHQPSYKDCAVRLRPLEPWDGV